MHVALATAYDLMRNLEKVQNRRKAVLYISSGYDFDPFVEGRLDEQARRMGITDSTDERGDLLAAAERRRNDPTYRDRRASQELSATDLIRDLYVLGYYSSNPDPLRRTRRIEVRTTRPNVTIRAREVYSLRPDR